MISFKIIERSGGESDAFFYDGRIHYKGRKLFPVSICSVMSQGSTGGIGGAVAGGLLLGGAGLIAGSVIGASRSKSAFIVKVSSGEELLCSVKDKDLPNLYRLIEEAIRTKDTVIKSLTDERSRLREKRERKYLLLCLWFGPFYFIRFGIISFVMVLILTVSTFCLVWPLLPFLAAALERGRRKRRIEALTSEINDLIASQTRSPEPLNHPVVLGLADSTSPV